MEQTAVEWLIETLTEEGFDLSLHTFEIKQANAMFEEQITNAFGEGIISAFCSSKMNGNEYYNETFKSE